MNHLPNFNGKTPESKTPLPRLAAFMAALAGDTDFDGNPGPGASYEQFRIMFLTSSPP